MVDERQVTIDAIIDEEEAEAPPVRPLSSVERQTFLTCEAMIAAGFETQTASLLAVETIRDQKLWRGDYRSWGDYTRQRWNKSQVRMNELIRSATVIENLAAGAERNSVCVGELPAEAERNSVSDVVPNTSQATELAKLDDPEEQREVWAEVTASKEPVTAKKVEKAVQAVKAEKVYPALATSGWSTEDVLTARRWLDSMPDQDREPAANLIGKPGVPADRALQALENLAAMEGERRTETLALYHSGDSRDQSMAVGRMLRQKAPADPRRLVLEMILPEFEHCARMFPDDPMSADLGRLAGEVREVIAAIKQQEAVRCNGSDAN